MNVLIFGQRSASSIDRRTNEGAASRNDLLTSSVLTSTRRRGAIGSTLWREPPLRFDEPATCITKAPRDQRIRNFGDPGFP